MKVYVVTIGDYDDYYIVGVFLTEEKAKLKCLALESDDVSARIEIYETADDSISGDASKAVYCYNGRVYPNGGVNVWSTLKREGSKPSVHYLSRDLYAVAFDLNCCDDEKAKKVALDMVAKYKARKADV